MIWPDTGDIIRCEKHGFDLDACLIAAFSNNSECVWTFDFDRKETANER